MYDVIIIGAGPAGMTAAIFTARKQLKTLVLSKDLGGQMAISADVENYTGFSMISGSELTAKFEEHIRHLGNVLALELGVEVVNIDKNITSFVVEDKLGHVYYAKTLIIATGRRPKHLGIPGELEWYGKGVSVCATCDAPLYKNRSVAVVGGGNSAMDALLALSKVAKLVYSININSKLVGEEILKQQVQTASNIQFFSNTRAVEIVGGSKLTGLAIERTDGKREVLGVDGVFVEVGWESETSFDRLTQKNEQGDIKVNKDLGSSVPGIFVAGDVNDAAGEQIIIAAGEGAKAALAVGVYLRSVK